MVKPAALPLLLVAASLVVPTALAQTPVDPTSSVTLAAGALTTASVGTTPVDLTVTLTLTNLICTAPGTATVTLAGADLPSSQAGISWTIAPTSLAFVVAGSANGAGPVNNYQQTMTAKLNVTILSSAPAGHPHEINVTAAFAPPVTSCQSMNPAGTVPAASASTSIRFTTPGTMGNTTATGGTTGLGTGTGNVPTSESPLADVPTVALMVLGAAFVALRRRLQ